MKVYIVEELLHEWEIVGVYTTLEGAQSQFPGREWVAGDGFWYAGHDSKVTIHARVLDANRLQRDELRNIEDANVRRQA